MEGDTEFWTSQVEAFRREGGAASVYARQHGLTLASLYYWRRKLKLAADTGDGDVYGSGPANKFVALHVVDTAVGAANSACTLVLPSDLRLELATLPSLATSPRTSRFRNTLMHPGCRIDQVFLCRDPVDFNKFIGGRSVLVEQALGLNPFDSALYVFINRDRNKIKVMY